MQGARARAARGTRVPVRDGRSGSSAEHFLRQAHLDADALPRWANSAMLAGLSSVSSLLALLLAGLLGRISGWPTVAATIVTTQFVQWVTGLGPVGDAVLAVARGQWLL